MARHQQRGMILPLAIFVLAGMVISVLVGINVLNVKQLNNRFAEDRQAYLDDVRTALGNWYQANAKIEAQSEFSYSSDELFSMIGQRARYGAKLIMSPQLNDGTVRYHKVAIVVPDTPKGASVGDGFGRYAPDGELSVTPGFVFKEFDGSHIQHATLLETTKAMQALATLLEQRVSAKMEVNPTSDNSINYFLPRVDCLHVAADEFPCTNGWVSIRSYLQETPLLGSSRGIVTRDAWGNDIEFNNDIAMNQMQPPFTASLRSLTPWGAQVLIKAVQPIF